VPGKIWVSGISVNVISNLPATDPPPPPPPPPPPATGSITREVWAGISGGAVSAIPLNTAPTSTGSIISFEAPPNANDNYGQRVRGYLTPPISGNYTFWIAGDDNVELYLSTTDQSSDKIKIAWHTGWTYSREWNRFTTQKSAIVTLNAGQRYYIEALMKEAGGSDNLAVGWAKPGQSTNAPSEVVPGSVLSPYTTLLVDRTLEAGGTITARGDNAQANEGKAQAFDNNINTKWLDWSATSWLQYGFANNESRVITRYVLTSGNDMPGRDPKNWTLQGSNNGTDFITLDTRANEIFSGRKLSKTYNFSNTTPYRFYRLNITANTDGGEITQLSELKLWGP
jgi:hypothetical protein